MGPPPQFRIEKTIPEDRPMSADGPSVEESQNILADANNGRWPSKHGAFDQSGERGTKLFADGSNQSKQDERPPSSNIEEGSQRGANNDLDAGEHKKVVRLSGLGYGARELSCHVEEAFGLPSSTSFVIDVSKNSGGDTEKESMLSQSGEHFGSEKDPQSTRTSSYSIGSQFPQFPFPPGIQGGDDICGGQVQKELTSHVVSRNSCRSVELSRAPSEKKLLRRTSRESQCLPPSGRTRARSSGLNSVDTGLVELAQLIDSTNKPRESQQDQVSVSSHKTPMISPAFPDRLASQSLPQRVDSRPPLLSSLSQQRGKELQMLVERQPTKRNTDRVCRVDPFSASAHDTKDVPNFSHQIPHKVVARSESPMLAPKPISPARQLKLKNSIPQIMKALPPIPPEPPYVKMIPNHEYTRSDDLTSLFSPISITMGASPLEVIEKDNTATQLTPKLPALPEDHSGLPKSESTSDQPNDNTTEQNAKNFIPKLKLKGKGSTASQAVLPSQPWGLKESHSKSNQGTFIQSPWTFPNQNASVLRPPKFRLRVIRASDSTLGTVRVTRDGGENTDSQGGAYPSNPKDLFTPSSGIENIFRQFGRHLHSHSQKASANSNCHGEESEPNFSRTTTSSPLGSSSGGDRSHSDGLPFGRIGGVEARSVFSDDSSQAQGHYSLRQCISNLRARIAVPYAAKSGAQSYDDITWKDRNCIHILPPPANHSDSNLHENRRSSETKPMRRLVKKLQRQRLKIKVRNWIKGARSVIARVRPGHSRAGSRSGNKAQ
jgi:hypothetical protein